MEYLEQKINKRKQWLIKWINQQKKQNKQNQPVIGEYVPQPKSVLKYNWLLAMVSHLDYKSNTYILRSKMSHEVVQMISLGYSDKS